MGKLQKESFLDARGYLGIKEKIILSFDLQK